MSHIFVQREIETSKVFSILSAVLKRYLFRQLSDNLFLEIFFEEKTILEPQNRPNIGEFILSRIQAQICQFYNVPQERNQNIFLCYMMLVCILIQKGNIVSIEITYKHIKTHK